MKDKDQDIEYTFTEALLTTEEKRQAQFKHLSPETYAKSRKQLLAAWLRREARINGWPVARLSCAIATELIEIAIEAAHTPMD